MPRLEDNDAKSLNALNTVIPETKRVNPKYKKPLKRPNPDLKNNYKERSRSLEDNFNEHKKTKEKENNQTIADNLKSKTTLNLTTKIRDTRQGK